ncbi:hypothetical protein UA08_09221 [Talaromyces atroroseus]|uniref:Uncharacterized protein n=1 Tax=Talaromyces atroroseus TaxID=1441469 RepID=A0A1Q5Q6L1_TALAT|nr:hypothetical protein UA08_09221 [Talaromyces atroroseus]OKL55485.1 hypothetical protein UA08_09221 [Talaromyces atroroseus]
MALPTPTAIPSRHPDCCLSFSSTLLDILTSTLRESIHSGLVLSVGSGTGLLEALLHSKWASSPNSQNEQPWIEGVEVLQSTSSASSFATRYLPEQCCETVKGTWEVSSRAEHAAAILFVYPRSPELVRRYMQKFAHPSSRLQAVIWLGPNCDWPEIQPCLAHGEGWLPVHVLLGAEAGLVDFEMMAIIRRPQEMP